MELSPKEEKRIKEKVKKEGEATTLSLSPQGCLGCLGLVVVIIVIVIALSGDNTNQPTPPSQAPLTKWEKWDRERRERVEPDERLEREYRQEISNISSMLSKSFSYISSFFQAKPNPILWTDEEKLTLATHMVIIRESYPQAKELKPPDKFKQAHNTVLAGLKKHHESMLILPKAIDNLDVRAINKATNLMLEGNVLIIKATKEIEAL